MTHAVGVQPLSVSWKCRTRFVVGCAPRSALKWMFSGGERMDDFPTTFTIEFLGANPTKIQPECLDTGAQSLQ